MASTPHSDIGQITDTTATVIFQESVDAAIASGKTGYAHMHFYNTYASGARTVTVEVYDGSTYFVIDKIEVSSEGRAITAMPIPLKTGWDIRLTSTDPGGELNWVLDMQIY